MEVSADEGKKKLNLNALPLSNKLEANLIDNIITLRFFVSSSTYCTQIKITLLFSQINQGNKSIVIKYSASGSKFN